MTSHFTGTEVRREWIVTKFGVWGGSSDLNNCAKIFGNRFEGLDSVRSNFDHCR